MPDDTVPPADDQVVDETTVPAGTDDTNGAVVPAVEPTSGDPQPADPSADTGLPEGIPALITDEDFERLKSDPAQLRNHLNRSYTPRMQAAAQALQLAALLEQDPEGTLAYLAQQRGFTIAKAQPPAPKSLFSDDETNVIKQLFGEDVAAQLTPLLDKVLQRHINPVMETTTTLHGKQAMAETQATLATMDKKYPDWKKYEKSMLTIARRIRPGEGVGDLEWMEHLYTLAKQKATTADTHGKVVGRINSSVKAAETRPASTPGARVAAGSSKNPTFQEAWAAARRGERLE